MKATRSDIRRIREAVLPAAIRAIVPVRVVGDPAPNESQYDGWAVEALKLAHVIAETAVAFDAIYAQEQQAARAQRKNHKNLVKRAQRNATEDDNAALVAAIGKGSSL